MLRLQSNSVSRKVAQDCVANTEAFVWLQKCLWSDVVCEIAGLGTEPQQNTMGLLTDT